MDEREQHPQPPAGPESNILDMLGVLSRERFLWEVRQLAAALDARFTSVEHRLQAMEDRMTAREDAAFAALTDNVDAVADGWAALLAENAVLKAAVANADQATQDAVAAALDADSDVDAGKVEAANAILGPLRLPVDNGGGGEPAPGDGGGEPDPNA